MADWWRCPNTPPCPHVGALHDIDEPGGREQCCIEGCGCGRRPTSAASAAPRSGLQEMDRGTDGRVR